MKLFPKPKSMSISTETLTRPARIFFVLTESLSRAFSQAGCELSFVENAFSPAYGTGTATVCNEQDDAQLPEGYLLTVAHSKITVQHSTPAGFYYAMQTLTSLAKGGEWHACTVQDAPAMAMRGAMLDIGRDKIPTMQTLFEYIDFFSRLRYNYLQLYMEGFCYDYRKYRYLFPDATPITGDEFEQLSRYAAARFIELVPNQNCLGHMDQWLAKPQLNRLAECPQGFLHQNLYMRPPMTLDARDEGSLDLVQYFLDELLPHTKGEYVNINLDEPFELGRGKNKAVCDEIGTQGLYLEFILKMHQLCASYGKKVMIWGDVLFTHLEIIEKLPQDILLLDWIYEGDASFETHCKALSAAKREFCLCPGTSSWASFAGRSDNMVKNVNDAVKNAIKYQGKGVMLTDWGDMGHWQYFSISKPAFAACGQAMWTGTPINLDEVADYCNREIFKDVSGQMFQILYDLGNYYKLEHAAVYNCTVSFSLMSNKYVYQDKQGFDECVERMLKLCANIAKENNIQCDITGIHLDEEALQALFDKTLLRLAKTQLTCNDAELLRSEVENTVAFIRHGLRLYLLLSGDTSKAAMQLQFDDLNEILKRHYVIWMAKNRAGGFSRSTLHLQHLLQLYAREANA